jgi:hypothetical protein
VNDVTVTRAEFLRDPAGILRRSENEGPILILAEDGTPSAVVSAPRDERITETERERLAYLEAKEDEPFPGTMRWCRREMLREAQAREAQGLATDADRRMIAQHAVGLP